MSITGGSIHEGAVTAHQAALSITESQISDLGPYNNYTHPGNVTTNINTANAEVLDVLNTDSTGHITSMSKRTMTLANLGYTGSATANDYTHPINSVTNLDTSGADVLDTLQTSSEGHITAMTKRTMTLADLGYTGSATANDYTHPSYNGDDFSVDTGALTGANIVSDVDINVTTDASGHVTDANGTIATRVLTLANLGYTGSATANDYTHSSNATTNVNTSGAEVIDQLSTSSEGHVTVLSKRTMTLSDLGYTGSTTANDYAHPDHTGHVTSTSDGATVLTVAAITGQTELASGLIGTDEFIVNDGGTIKRVDASVIKDYIDANLTGSSWSIKTTTYTAVAGDQIICNSASPFTVTLPASPSSGDPVTLSSAGAGLVTVGRNGENINSAAEDGSLPTGNSTQLIYVDATVGWFEV